MTDNKRAVVTGAAGQIGAATCRRLCADGWTVLGVDVDEVGGAKLAAELGGPLQFHAADVSTEDGVQGYVAAAVERLGGIDGFFNNAGTEGAIAPIAQFPMDRFDALIALNVRGVFLGLKHVMAAMAAGGGGSIVNTSSVAGQIAFPGLSAYVASKHAVVGLTKAAAVEGAGAGIRVNAVCPGPIEGRRASPRCSGPGSGATKRLWGARRGPGAVAPARAPDRN